jgi:hypothetical protein
MTRNKAQKTVIRQRMADTGEPYSVARHTIEGEQVPADPPEPARAAPHPTPRDDRWYATMAEEAGISVAEFKAQVDAEEAADRADEARHRAEAAQHRADTAEERAEEAQEAAELAQEAADLAMEAANLTRDWADDQEQDRARQRADQAQETADRAQEAADRAQRQADRAQEAAEEAEEAADELEELAGELAKDSRDLAGPPSSQPRDGGRDQAWAELGDTLQDRLAGVLQRFDRARERADRFMSRAQQRLNPARDEGEWP